MMPSGKYKSLLIIYTGGTIGMVRDPASGSLHPLPFSNMVDEIPELKRSAYQLSSHAFSPLIDSSDVNPEVWIKLAQLIEENYNRYDGFVILHGTDTMAYSASALSFMLENLSKPVIFTGSQLPIDIPRTDAKENLLTAIEIAASHRDGKPVITEVAIFFQSILFRGNRTVKHNAEEFKAFRSFNYQALAETGVHIRFNYPAILHNSSGDEFRIHTNLDTNVSLLKIYPGMNQQVIHSILSVNNLRAIVLESFGAGNAPVESWLLNEMATAIKRGIIFLNVTQCAQGSVEMGLYDSSIALEKLGVVSGRDMTTEAALTKLMYLLGKYSSPEDIRNDLNKSLRGEITI